MSFASIAHGFAPISKVAAPLGAIVITAAILLASPGISLAKQKVIILCDEGYPPYSYAQNGEPKGIYPDILRAIFDKMDGYDITIKPVPWKRGLKEIEKGSAFALLPPYKRPVERPWMDYSDPILSERFVVFLRADLMSQPRASWPDDFKGLTIGKNAGFAVPENDAVKQAMRQGELAFAEASNAEQNLLKLNARRIDGYINDPTSIESVWNSLLKQGKVRGEIRQTVTISNEDGYLGITKAQLDEYPFREDFVKHFNLILADMKASGKIDAIVSSHFASTEASR